MFHWHLYSSETKHFSILSKVKLYCFLPLIKRRKMSTGKGTKRAATASMAGTSAAARAQTFSIEYAKSSLSTCSECQLKIPRNEIRVKITVPDPQQLQDGGQVIFFHVECFAASRNKLDWMDSADLLPGFSELYAHDQATVMIQLP